MPPDFYRMIDVTLICVGRLKEQVYKDACAEYMKRLGAFCRVTVTEAAEERKRENPSPAEVEACLLKEAEAIKRAVPRGAAVVALCVEGMEELSRGSSKLCFIIGGSDGLHQSVKDMAALRLSMSPMTFPHHLARVMVLEQIYRAFTILNRGKYHK